MSTLRDALDNLPDTVFADLLESDEAYLLVVDFPGVTADTTTISTTDGSLNIEAHREKEVPDGFRYIQEERSLILDTDLPIPSDASGAGAKATIQRGVLELYLPKEQITEETSIPVEDA